MSEDGQYLGSWVLPSGNGCDVYWGERGVVARWDSTPGPEWTDEDIRHWKTVTFPEVIRAIEILTGKKVLGVSL